MEPAVCVASFISAFTYSSQNTARHYYYHGHPCFPQHPKYSQFDFELSLSCKPLLLEPCNVSITRSWSEMFQWVSLYECVSITTMLGPV